MRKLLKYAGTLCVLILAQAVPAIAQEAAEPPIVIGSGDIAISGIVIDVDAGSFTVSSAGSEVEINTENMDIANLDELIIEGMAVEVAGNLNGTGPAIEAEEIRIIGMVETDINAPSGSLPEEAVPSRRMIPLTNPEAAPIFLPRE